MSSVSPNAYNWETFLTETDKLQGQLLCRPRDGNQICYRAAGEGWPVGGRCQVNGGLPGFGRCSRCCEC